ncbi:MAG: DUF624 domain-containing protein [Oscillospiraceae bacterium]|nr:DUF624 domain-containing protein [Oscillospiraceae bacterium]
MNSKKKENPFFTILFKIIDLVGATSLFVIFSLPLITSGASLSALYYTIRRNIREEKNHVWNCFWHSFKMNLKQGMGLTVIFLAAAVILMGDIAAVRTLAEGGRISSGFSFLFYAVAALIAVYANWVFIYLSRYDNTVKATLKNAFIISVSNLPVTLIMLGSIVVTVIVVALMPITLIIMPGLAAWIMSYRAEKVFEKYSDD